MTLGTDLRHAFEQTLVQHHLRVLDPSYATIRTEHTFCLRAVANTRFFERAYNWSGQGIEKDPVVTSGRDSLGHSHHQVHGPVLAAHSHRLFLVDLGRTLEPGQEDIVAIEQTFIDVSGTFDAQLSHHAMPGCREIELRVSAPPGSIIDPVLTSRYAVGENPLSRLPLETAADENGNDTVRATVRDVDVGHVYGVTWTKP